LKNAVRLPFVIMAAWFLPLLPAQAETPVQLPERARDEIRTIDYMIPHISSVPATSGKRVQLFLREKVQSGAMEGQRGRRKAPAVLMIHGATTSVGPAFDLPFEDYSWMEYLASEGFDVFALDHTGYGLSPRPMMENPCNASPTEQQKYLTPFPIPQQPCSASYPFALTTIESDWDEIDTAVDYILRLRDLDRVNIIGWSRGGPRAGGYAALNPEKVDRMVLLAPGYPPTTQNNPPAVVPAAGYPFTVLSTADMHNGWDTQAGSVKTFSPKIRPVINSTIYDYDYLGGTWGTAGVRRAPVWTPLWGWNKSLASRIEAPTLVIRGDLDTQVPVAQVKALYEDLWRQKVYVTVTNGTHFLQWEYQHKSLLEASSEWLRHGTYDGYATGTFLVDAAGKVHKDPPSPSGLALSAAAAKIGGSYTATMTGTNLTDRTYFDVRYREPGSTVDLEALNWQQGTNASHQVLAGCPQGIWTINGVRAHENVNDHYGAYSPVSVQLTVTP
jgi:pimeloyl-ACP methyl ester carboxylesterase